MHRIRPYILVGVVVVALFALPMSAMAFSVLGDATNAFGNSYATSTACAGCHPDSGGGATVLDPSPHSLMVTDIDANPDLLVPNPITDPDYWPAPTYGGGAGLSLDPASVFLQLGDPIGELEYVGHEGDAAVNPIDDLPLWDPLGFSQEEFAWTLEAPDPVGAVAYFQRCGGCHNTGVTRSADASYALANGGEIGPNTPTEVNELSIGCESCHGAGEGNHFGQPQIVRDDQILKSQVCGQCHTTGQAIAADGTKILRVGSASSYQSSPNGYTTDETLTEYFSIEGTVPTEADFLASPTSYRFFPNGSNRNMNHAYYNEWLKNDSGSGFGHINALNNSARTNAESTKCIRCHSGQGFLYRIGAGASNDPAEPLYDTVPTTGSVAANNFGISCQVCHSGHVGYTPDGTDYDFARKWDNGNEVTCEDCHNWQIEVMEQTPQTEVIDSVTYHRPVLNASRISHPQREMLHGGEAVAVNDGDTIPNGMWGVAPMGEFMPGTECTSCHMPETRMGRDSHRFKVMEPGDAEAWGAYADSCQPCHPSSSQADLQLWLEDTQAEVAAELSAAQAALTAVVADQGDGRTWTRFMTAQPTSWTIDPSVYALLQKAAQNVFFVNQDASIGIHNPAYALAGLEVAREYTAVYGAALDIVASSDFVPSGAGVGLSGTLLDINGDPIASAMVIVEYSTDGGATWGEVATVMTDALGNYAAVYAGPITDATMFRAAYHVSGAMIHSNDVTVDIVVDGAGITPERVAGADRFGTAVALSQSTFGTGACTDIVLASGLGFPDALSASGLAGTLGSPIMLSLTNAVPAAVMTEIDRLSTTDDSQTTIWIVGGTGVVSNAVVTQLEGEGYTVERVAGIDRYDTSVEVAYAIADLQGPGFVDSFFVANGLNFADALAASPVAWSNAMPILLTPTAALNTGVGDAIEDLGYTEAIALGGTAAVSAGVATEIDAIPSVTSVVRWAGTDRFGTAVDIANKAKAAGLADFAYVGVANGLDFPDALAGGPVAGSYGGVMIMVTPTSVPAASSAFFTANKAEIMAVEIYGGSGAVSAGVMTTIQGLLQ